MVRLSYLGGQVVRLSGQSVRHYAPPHHSSGDWRGGEWVGFVGRLNIDHNITMYSHKTSHKLSGAFTKKTQSC